MVKVRGQKSPSAGIVAMLAVDETTRPTLEIDVFFLKFKPMLLFRSVKRGSPASDLSAPTHTNLICCIRLSAGRSNRATWHVDPSREIIYLWGCSNRQMQTGSAMAK